MSEMTPKERFELALAQTNPGNALYELARNLKREGMSQLDMYRLYNEFRAKVGEEDQVRLEAILDTMDFIVGWGNRACWIFDQELDRSLYDPMFMIDEGKGEDRKR